MEVTVTMLVAGLVIGLTYTCYSIVFKSYLSVKSKNDNTALLANLDHVLQRDFDQATIILKTADGLVVKKDSSQIKYAILSDYILRVSAKTDTFKVQSEGLATLFENAPVTDENETDEQNRIDDLSFTVHFQNEKMFCRYHKSYSSVNLIERGSNAVH